MKSVVLVHGAWHGPWCWERVTPLLAARGIETHTVALPTCDPDAGFPTTLHDDAKALRKTLDTLHVPAIVVGHSYGGMVITEGAANHPRVARLVYLAAFMPDTGESVGALATTAPSLSMFGAIANQPDGRSALVSERLGPVLYGDCDADTVAWAQANVRSMLGGMGGEVADAIAWQETPSTYVVCTDDRVVLPDLQRRMAQRATDVIEWGTSHSPFASRPDLVADLLADLAAS